VILKNQGVDQCTIQVNEYQPGNDIDGDVSESDDSSSQGTVVENNGVIRVKDDNRYGLVGGETDDEMV